MQKTPWFHEEQADVMLNYLPLRNVLIQDIKATVKNKALPDSARLCIPLSSHSLSLSLFLSLSLTDLALSRLVSHVFSLLPMPFILRVSPGSCWGWTPAFIKEREDILQKPFGCQNLSLPNFTFIRIFWMVKEVRNNTMFRLSLVV